MKRYLLIAALAIVPSLSYSSSNLVDKVSEEFNKQVLCMARNLYYEAGSESYEGKLAVAQVTMNRTRHPNFPSTVCDVVYQRINGIYQFSWVGESVKRITNSRAWEESMSIAKRALTEHKVHDTIYKSKAMYFHNTTVNPEWNLRYITQIGNHLFYARHNAHKN